MAVGVGSGVAVGVGSGGAADSTVAVGVTGAAAVGVGSPEPAAVGAVIAAGVSVAAASTVDTAGAAAVGVLAAVGVRGKPGATTGAPALSETVRRWVTKMLATASTATTESAASTSRRVGRLRSRTLMEGLPSRHGTHPGAPCQLPP